LRTQNRLLSSGAGRMTHDSRRPQHVVLLGLMGAGKTSVGRSLALRLGCRLSDSDEQIRLKTGKTVRQLRNDIGVDAMHALESDHLLAALAEVEPSVVCAAASVVDDERCRDALSNSQATTVWLRATPRTLAERFVSSSHRPLYGDDPASFLLDQSASRSPFFGAVSRVIVDVDDLTVERVTDSIWSTFKRSGLRAG
jgi:shikimate kinase